MIINVNIYQALVDTSSEQGWNEESQILHLCGFINSLYDNADIPTGFAPEVQLRRYLQACADEENAGVEAVCEKCGDPCDYHSELCLCEKCEKEAAST